VRLVIADTGPVNYLVLIGHIEILRALFETVVLPSVVRDELADRGAPPAVRQWIADPPAWIEMRDASGAGLGDSSLERLDAGEAAAIILAIELSADLLLIDDRAGVIAARHKGFRVAGTLGILGMAAQHGLLDLADAFSRLKRTSFHCRPEIMDRFLNDAPGNK
jgi:predicted nucleic acid-binding protein